MKKETENTIPKTETKPRKTLGGLWKSWAFAEPYQDNPESYAYGLSPYKLMWLFAIGCFMGYLMETVWYFSLRGYYVNRQGILYGPFSPIYGVAFVGITAALYKIRRSNALHLFLITGIAGGLFEYVCSVLQEKVLGTRSWDYSHLPFNIEGRVCLRMMILWGIVGTIFIRSTYPFLSKCIENIPRKWGKIFAIGLTVFLLLDCLLSLVVCLRQKDRWNGIEPRNQIEQFFDDYYPDETLEQIYTEIRKVE